MKSIIMTISALFLFASCSKVDGVNPSQNKALNSVNGKKEKSQSGYMQQAVDKWLEEDWTPRVEKNEAIKKANKDEDREFTLQEYVDKIVIYNKELNATFEDSHTQKVNSMPVIGGKK